MKAPKKFKFYNVCLIAILIFSSCDKEKKESSPRPEGQDFSTAIWVSFDDVLYRIDDLRSPSLDYSVPYEMQVGKQIDLGGTVTNGVLATSTTVIYNDVKGEIKEMESNPPFDILSQGSIGFNPSAPLLSSFGFYAVGTNGNIHRMYGGLGSEWQTDLGGNLEIHASPCTVRSDFGNDDIIDEKIIVGASDGGVRAIEEETGSLLWMYNTGGPVYSNPLRYNRVPDVETYNVIVGSDDGIVYSLEESDGSLVWQFETGGAVRSSPTVNHWAEPHYSVEFDDPLVYFGSDDWKVYAVDPTFGDLRWVIPTGGPVRSSPCFLVTSENFFDQVGLVIVGSDDGKVYCFHSHTGIIKWTRDLDAGPIRTSPVALQNGGIRSDISRNTVYVSTTRGLFGLDAESGQILSQKLIPSKDMSSPVALIKYDDEYWQGPWYPSTYSVSP